MSFKPGLIVEKSKRRILGTSPVSYRNPVHIDRRFELLPASDQGQTEECVAYSVAGLIEGYRWANQNIYAQIDPHNLYLEAKRIDGYNQEGTTLEAGIQAAENIGLISNLENDSIRTVDTIPEVCRALHKNRFLIAAFNVHSGWLNVGSSGFIREGSGIIGGHAVLLCGYSEIVRDDKGKIRPFIMFENSWGAQGWRGFNRIDYDLFEKDLVYCLTFDFTL